MVTKKEFQKSFLQEYWGNSCALCHSTRMPEIKFSDKNDIYSITATCKSCGMKISYNNHITYNNHTKEKLQKIWRNHSFS